MQPCSPPTLSFPFRLPSPALRSRFRSPFPAMAKQQVPAFVAWAVAAMVVAVFLPATVSGARDVKAAGDTGFVVEGRVFCDTCRAGFETPKTTYIAGKISPPPLLPTAAAWFRTPAIGYRRAAGRILRERFSIVMWEVFCEKRRGNGLGSS